MVNGGPVPQVQKNGVADEVGNILRQVRPLVNEQLETLRRDKVIGKSIDAAVTIEGQGPIMDTLRRYESQLPELLIVSAVNLQPGESDIQVRALQASGERCPRSLRWVPALVETEYGRVSPRDAEALKSLNT